MHGDERAPRGRLLQDARRFILARGGSASTTHLQRETPKLDHSRDMRFQIGTGRTRSRLHLFDVRFCVH